MAKLTLTIEADNAAELMNEADALFGRTSITTAVPVQTIGPDEGFGGAVDAEAEALRMEQPAKRTRRTKEQIAADEAAARTPAPASKTADDPFADQVREAVQDEAPAEITLDKLKSLAAVFNAEHGAQATRGKLNDFTDEAGEVVNQFKNLQPKDYAAFVASLG